MKKFLIFLMSVLLLISCNIDNNREVSTSIKMDTSVIEKVTKAVVGVSGISEDGESIGSGVCVSPKGFIITNSHVVNGSKDIKIYMYNKNISSAKIVYEDKIMDFAILKCETNMPYLLLNNTNKLTVGQEILAVGTPISLNLTHTFTKGIVSALNRTLKINAGNGVGFMQNLIQHDASLNPGNSGGPLINSLGEVVGINTLKIKGGEGIGFAIPTKTFSSLLSKFCNDNNYKKPNLGICGIDNEIANFKKLNNIKNGFYVLDVLKDSSLYNCGLQSGDVILKFNGRTINNTLDLKDELYLCSRGDWVEIQFVKNNHIKKAKIQLN